MGTPNLRTLVNPVGLGRDTPFDAGPNTDQALLYLILSELRIHSHLLSEMINGAVDSDHPSILRKDNLIEPNFMRQPL